MNLPIPALCFVEETRNCSSDMLTDRRTRVLLIESLATARAGLRFLLDALPGLKVVGDTGNRTDALALAKREQPQLILLDIHALETSGFDLVTELYRVAEEAQVMVLAGVEDVSSYQNALRHGAIGIMLKEQLAGVLMRSIENIQARDACAKLDPFFNPKETRLPSPETIRIASLTEREREVINLVGQALKNQQIADLLFISETTVRHHLTSIFGKLHVTSRLGLIIYAYQNGLIKLILPEHSYVGNT